MLLQHFSCIFGIYIKFPLVWTKRSLISQVFLKWLSPKYILIYLNNRAWFWKPFDKYLYRSLKSSWNPQESSFILLFHHSKPNWVRKSYFFITSYILVLIDNKLTVNYESSRTNRENLQLPIQIKLSENPAIFCQIFLSFLEFILNLKCSEK